MLPCSQGLLTTPQLHYFVRLINTREGCSRPGEEIYYKDLSEAFGKLVELSSVVDFTPHPLIIDGANGVGALQMTKTLAAMKGLPLQATVTFDGSQGKLNFEVYVIISVMKCHVTVMCLLSL